MLVSSRGLLDAISRPPSSSPNGDRCSDVLADSPTTRTSNGPTASANFLRARQRAGVPPTRRGASAESPVSLAGTLGDDQEKLMTTLTWTCWPFCTDTGIGRIVLVTVTLPARFAPVQAAGATVLRQ